MLIGETLYLKPYEPEDWPQLYQYYLQNKYRDFFRHYPKVFNKEAFKQYHNIVGGELFWIMDGLDIAGFLSITMDNKANRGFYIGLFIDENFQKQHIPTEAMIIAMKYAFDTLGLNKCIVCVLAENKALNRTLQKTNFFLEGILDAECFQDGIYKDEVRYSMLADDFRVIHKEFKGSRICRD